jgi:hypothetical protein
MPMVIFQRHCRCNPLPMCLFTISNSFDYNDQTGGTSFKAGLENWSAYHLLKEFTKWGAKNISKSLFDLRENALILWHIRDSSGRQQRQRG